MLESVINSSKLLQALSEETDPGANIQGRLSAEAFIRKKFVDQNLDAPLRVVHGQRAEEFFTQSLVDVFLFANCASHGRFVPQGGPLSSKRRRVAFSLRGRSFQHRHR